MKAFHNYSICLALFLSIYRFLSFTAWLYGLFSSTDCFTGCGYAIGASDLSLNVLYRVTGDLDLSSDLGLDNFLTEDGLPSTANGTTERNAIGLPKLSPTEVDITRNTTVKFEDGSDDESSVNGAESEVALVLIYVLILATDRTRKCHSYYSDLCMGLIL